jgi:tRNA threonylcarbamoyladenosine modification (KEOPS) complex  Pcc1 subunit
MNAVAEALSPELSRPGGDRARARIFVRGRQLRLQFEAKDSTAIRAIMSSWLRMLAASLNVSTSLIQLEGSYQRSKSDKRAE